MSATPNGCPAGLMIVGQYYRCDWPTDAEGKHDGWAHANREAEAIWIDDSALLGSQPEGQPSS